MNRTLKLIALTALAVTLPTVASAQQRDGGTPGRIAKFTTNGKVVDSNVTEGDGGKIGVGTTAPTSPLTVNGLVETTGAGGGVKFADGSVQTTAVLPYVVTDPSLMGAGTAASRLSSAPCSVRLGRP